MLEGFYCGFRVPSAYMLYDNSPGHLPHSEVALLNTNDRTVTIEVHSETPGSNDLDHHDHGQGHHRSRSNGDIMDLDQDRKKEFREMLRSSSSAETILSDGDGLDSHHHGFRTYEKEEIESFKSQGWHSLMNYLSLSYCLILIICGFGFPIAELTADSLENNYYQAYYIFLFGMGLIYMIFSYMFLVTPIPKHQEMAKSFRRWKRNINKQNFRERFNSIHVPTDPPQATYTSAARASSFYLRMDAVFFGLGSMVFSGFEFGQFFEYPEGSRCRNISAFAVPVFRFFFTFAQLYFLFLNIRIRTDKFTTLTRFGLMHILGTNMVIWVTSLIEETSHAVAHYSSPAEHVLSGDHHDDPHGPSTYEIAIGVDHNISQVLASLLPENSSLDISKMGLDVTGVVADEIMNSCRRKSMIGQVLQRAAPVLYPFIVEYSLICAALIYVYWRNIGILIGPGRRMFRLSREAASGIIMDAINDLDSHTHKRHQYTVDCKGSTNGMFMGILTIVAMVIIMVLFFFWISLSNYKFLAVLEVYISIIVLYTMTTVAVVVAFIKLQDFRFDDRVGSTLDDVLLVTSQMGVIVFNLFIIICGHHRAKAKDEDPQKDVADILGLTASSIETIQSLFQTIFLLDASRRRPYKQSHIEKRPGRELITFLLVTNFGMWFLDTLESWRRQLHPVQIEFFGFWPWILITHISMPLTIFYRFHSSVVLSEIWKKSYKTK
ncbi:hypothetical protein RvY_10001-2 [Ramazzottius varieornatus]|uniref:Otopetrin n=1 Tax=Ramazzottius varieornatus TaxID=947166 RepID=A0A1D1VGM9_RAMVA|nr:hypothetical protein RvY_10001-2 [Ramazzottius varieornatus]